MDQQTSTELAGMAAVKAWLKTQPAGCRSLAWLGRQMNLTRPAVALWGDTIPQARVEAVSRITGLTPRVLRPDLAELFDRKVDA